MVMNISVLNVAPFNCTISLGTIERSTITMGHKLCSVTTPPPPPIVGEQQHGIRDPSIHWADAVESLSSVPDNVHSRVDKTSLWTS